VLALATSRDAVGITPDCRAGQPGRGGEWQPAGGTPPAVLSYLAGRAAASWLRPGDRGGAPRPPSRQTLGMVGPAQAGSPRACVLDRGVATPGAGLARSRRTPRHALGGGPTNDGQLIWYDAVVAPGSLLGHVNADHWAIAMPLTQQLPALAFLFQDDVPRLALIEAAIEVVDDILRVSSVRDRK
jgi:hypothetical protein